MSHSDDSLLSPPTPLWVGDFLDYQSDQCIRYCAEIEYVRTEDHPITMTNSKSTCVAVDAECTFWKTQYAKELTFTERVQKAEIQVIRSGDMVADMWLPLNPFSTMDPNTGLGGWDI